MSGPGETDPARSAARFTSLCAALVLMIAVSPLFDGPNAGVLLRLMFTLVLLTGTYAVSRSRRVRWMSVVMIAPLIVIEWLTFRGDLGEPTVPLLVAEGAFLVFVVTLLLKEILSETTVGVDTVAGGISVYLLLTIVWALQYSVVEHLAPGSFLVHGVPLAHVESVESRHPILFYFSFVTITTLGYGDVTPATPVTRIMAASEAVVGQLYVAIFVARLVGLYLVHSASRE